MTAPAKLMPVPVAIADAFDKASGEKTPWNPSKSATARVTNPLPAPTSCPYCEGPVSLVSNAKIYGREYGDWPWAYACDNRACNSYVGIHPFTNIPLGTLANEQLRAARVAAKAVFNPMWKPGNAQIFSRSTAYLWLADALGINDAGACHIAWFDVATCLRVVDVCKAFTSLDEKYVRVLHSQKSPVAPGKVRCKICAKHVKINGLKDHMRDAHGVKK